MNTRGKVHEGWIFPSFDLSRRMAIPLMGKPTLRVRALAMRFRRLIKHLTASIENPSASVRFMLGKNRLKFINRSYHPEHTRSHQNSEVKQDWARLVLRSVTTWESLVTIVPFFFRRERAFTSLFRTTLNSISFMKTILVDHPIRATDVAVTTP